MKRLLLAVSALALFAASSASAQEGLSIGGRFGSYSTDLDSGFTQVETGRQNTVGFMATYRSNGLVIDGAVDHDFESGVSIADILPIDFGDYERDRIEAGVGYAVTPFLDVMGGFRSEEITLGGEFFGIDFFDDLNFDHQAIFAGVNAHSTSIRPVGWYVSGRGYLGSSEFDVQNERVKSDTTGLRVEAGLPIALGLSGWEVAPGVEWEMLETDDYGLDIDTNRFFIAFRYNSGR